MLPMRIFRGISRIVSDDRGMSTAEYAVGTLAACAFAALLFRVVSSGALQDGLTALLQRALATI